MSVPAFQKVEMPNGKQYIITRSGIGQADMEFVVNETSYRGNVFQMYGTYDECMDFIAELASSVTDEAPVDGMAAAVREIADENFHRELG